MTQERKGDWIATYTGGQFWPIDPRPEEIEIEDIAHALSNICRYAGHLRQYMSVAEHCVLLAYVMRDEGYPIDVVRWALLHDAPEAYICDMPRPVKRNMPEYKIIEDRIEIAVADKFQLPLPIPAIVKEYDIRICNDEREQGMNRCVSEWDDMGEPLNIRIQFWSPNIAKGAFLRLYEELF